MQTLQVKGQADEGPFMADGIKTTQGKLAKAECSLDDADDRFNGSFAQAINFFADGGLQLVSHVHREGGIDWRWFRFGSETLLPALMMRLTAGGNIGFEPRASHAAMVCALK
jgi:hypothetical protein